MRVVVGMAQGNNDCLLERSNRWEDNVKVGSVEGWLLEHLQDRDGWWMWAPQQP